MEKLNYKLTMKDKDTQFLGRAEIKISRYKPRFPFSLLFYSKSLYNFHFNTNISHENWLTCLKFQL